MCQRAIADDTRHVMHCNKCCAAGPVAAGAANGFDICPECWAKMRDALFVAPRILNAVGCPMFPGVGDCWQTLYVRGSLLHCCFVTF